MVRASAAGAIDFARADLEDNWWWRTLQWTLTEFHRKEKRELLAIQHNHWITAFTNTRLEQPARETSLKNAQEALDDLFHEYYPWLAHEKTTAADATVDTFREMYGYPGEERYEMMLQELQAAGEEIKRRLARQAAMEG